MSTKKEEILRKFDEYAEKYDLVDNKIKQILKIDKREVYEKDDDVFYIIAGTTGSGKSNLAHHIHHLWTIGNPSMERVSLDAEEFPKKIRESLKEKDLNKRVSHFDEANVNKRDAMTGFNKDLLKLYFAIRGKRALHIWCNPSIDQLDKPFYEERINGIFYTFKKPLGRYIFIPRDNILEMIDNKIPLKKKYMESKGTNHAIIKNGFFKRYPQDQFKQEYDRIKEERGDYVLEWIMSKHGTEQTYHINKVKQVLGNINHKEFKTTLDKMKEQNLIDEDEIQGTILNQRFKQETINKIEEYLNQQKKEEREEVKEVDFWTSLNAC